MEMKKRYGDARMPCSILPAWDISTRERAVGVDRSESNVLSR
jgi:hypothetical protein